MNVAEYAESEWQRVKPWIETALEYADGTHTIEDIADGIRSDRFQLWCGDNAAIVTEILEFPRLKAVNFFLIAGDLKELVEEMEPEVVKWAKSFGCQRVIGVGRKGFERVFRSKGYTPRWHYIAREL